jgi:hypothetical protein
MRHPLLLRRLYTLIEHSQVSRRKQPLCLQQLGESLAFRQSRLLRPDADGPSGEQTADRQDS